MRRLTSTGSFMLAGVHYLVGGLHGFQQVLVSVDGGKITVDLDGEIFTAHTRPAPGVTYVGNGRPRGPPTQEPRHVTHVPRDHTRRVMPECRRA